MFHSYVKLPEGIWGDSSRFIQKCQSELSEWIWVYLKMLGIFPMK